jgi:rhodanese-related sulfurtransferase
VEWTKVCDELGIERIQPPSKSDHRMMSGAENAVVLRGRRLGSEETAECHIPDPRAHALRELR